MSKIKYKLKTDNTIFDTVEDLMDYYGMTPTWIENNLEEIDIESDEYILKDIPKEFHSALTWMAYEHGHSAGESEVRNYLKGYVEDFRKPIQAFEKRLREELTR
jgi:plasmid stability protein